MTFPSDLDSPGPTDVRYMLRSFSREFLPRLMNHFELGPLSVHGPSHWQTVLKNGLYLCKHHPEADRGVVRLFALFHDSCRENEFRAPGHGSRAAKLAVEFRKAGLFTLDDGAMSLLVTACKIHNGAAPQSHPTLGVCLDADRLDLGRVGIIPHPALLSTTTARAIARGEHTLP